MRILPLLLLPVLTLCLALPAHSQTKGTEKKEVAEKKASAEKKEAASALHDKMEGMNRSMRRLNRQYTDPAQKDSSLKIIDELRKSVQESKELKSARQEKLQGEEQKKYIEVYGKAINALDEELVKLRADIEAGKTDDAKATIARIGKLKDSSHKELGVEDDH